MKIYTGFFAKAAQYAAGKLVCVSIALKAPPTYVGSTFKPLAPSWLLLTDYKNHEINEAEYTRRYNAEVLRPLDKASVRAGLDRISGGRDVVLLCWEGPNKFCHRHIVAQWLGLENEEI